MYHYGLTLRKCRNILSDFGDISNESIRKRYHKVYTILTVKTVYRETVAVGETNKHYDQWKIVYSLGSKYIQVTGNYFVYGLLKVVHQ